MVKTYILILSILCNIFLVYVVFVKELKKDSELGSKNAWSILQIVENKYRGKEILGGLNFFNDYEGSGLNVVGIGKASEKGNVWFIANPKVEPFVKFLPSSAKVRISQNTYNMITSEVSLSRDIDIFLRNSVK